MSKTRDTGFLGNVVKVDNTGNVSFVSGSTTLMSISSSGAVTTTGVISGSNALTSSYSQNSELLDNLDSTSFVFTSSFNTYSSSMSTRVTNNESTGSTLTSASASLNTASGSFSTRVTKIEGNYATTGSNVFLGAQTVCANITSTGTIIAQTLNVQQVTSSVVYSSGSNVFGCSLSNTQQFTGSVTMTGSLTVTTAGTSPEFQVAVGGTTIGNALTDVHQVTGSLRITGSNALFSVGCVGIGTTTPARSLHIAISCNSTYATTSEGNALLIANTCAIANSYVGIQFATEPAAGNASTAAINVISAGAGNGDISFSTRTGSTLGERVRIVNDGKVGIGTCTPGTKLQVDASGNDTVGFFGASGMTAGQSVYFQVGKNCTSINNAGEISFRYCADDSSCNMVSLGFYGNGQKLNIVKSGNVGIGSTNPVALLHLRGSGTSGQVTATQIWENTSSGTLGLEINGSAGSSYAVFKYGGGPGTGTAGLTQAMAIVLEGAGAGRVGIGTITVNNKLDILQNGSSANSVNGLGLKIYGDANTNVVMGLSQTARGTVSLGMQCASAAPAAFVLGTDVCGELIFKNQLSSYCDLSTGTSLLFICRNGNVGIGCTTPGVTLTIGGTDAIRIPTGTTAQRPTGAAGLIRMNTTTGQPEWYNTATSTWAAFNQDTNSYLVEYLVVGGGGGGGYDNGGGGGAGGFVLDCGLAVTSCMSYSVVVGAGGSATVGVSGHGGASCFNGVVALGGGGAGGQSYQGDDGGSGGGSMGYPGGALRGGFGTIGQGFEGGCWLSTSYPYIGSGGGGACQRGFDGPSNGMGGSGKISTLLGNTCYYAGGGNGSGDSVGCLVQSCGGGGIAGNPTGGNANPNSGGGGGGGQNGPYYGGNGGSGIVIIRYPGCQRGSGGTICSYCGTTIHVFLSSGTFVA